MRVNHTSAAAKAVAAQARAVAAQARGLGLEVKVRYFKTFQSLLNYLKKMA